MKSPNKILLYMTALFLLMVGMVNTFMESGLPKTLSNVVIYTGYAYGVLNRLFAKRRYFKMLNYRLRGHALGRLLVGEEPSEVVTEGGAYNEFKAELLRFTLLDVNKRFTVVNSPDIFSTDFAVFDYKEFEPGTKPVNQNKDWENHLQEQFVFITGESGSGKTVELIKRAKFLCDKLRPGLEAFALLDKEKIPVYIELKSLDQPLDVDWLKTYLLKTAGIANITLDEMQLESLLKRRDVVYFFDGLDEVNPAYRLICINEIIEKFTRTGLTVACRKEIFNDLRDRNKIPQVNFPAEVYLPPLDETLMKRIINSLNNRPVEERQEMIYMIDNKPSLRIHLSRAIILNLFIIVYQRLTEEEKQKIATSDENGVMDILWENYEDIIFRKKLPRGSDILGIRTITVWLAKIMGQEAFYVESIQPRWLSRISRVNTIVQFKAVQRLYYLTTRIIAALIIGIAMGCVIATPFALVSNSIIGGMTISALAGIYNGRLGRFRFYRIVSDPLLSLTMMVLLILVCGGYQGFVLPRAPGEMITPYFSIAECWPGIILGFALSTIFSYRIIMEKRKGQYILPLELFHFDWPHAVRYGLSWGVASGVITGSIAVYVKHQYHDHIFIQQWLIPYLNRIILSFNGAKLNAQNQDYAVFAYAFLLTFVVASMIIILLAGRYNDAVETNDENKQQLNFGIIESRKHAIKHAAKVAACAAVLYYLAMLKLHMGSWYFCMKITIGVSLLAFLWFGGMEVINHRILRLNLFLRGIAPLDYSEWVQAQQNMGLIIPSGYQMKFYHTTLAAYYGRYPLADNSRIRLKKNTSKDVWSYIFIILSCVIMLWMPFLRRYGLKTFWKSPGDVELHLEGFKHLPGGSFAAQKRGIYKIESGGYINVGTFVGYVLPEGTLYGFMGMPIDSAYNLKGFGKFRHAALLYRTHIAGKSWTAYHYITDIKQLAFDKDEEIEFMVNDKEWQNNLGHYSISSKFCDTCKVKVPK